MSCDLRIALDGVRCLPHYRLVGRRRTQQHGPAEYGGQWRAKFVRESGKEHVLGAVGCLGFQARRLLIGQQCRPLLLKPRTLADITDVALDDRVLILLVDVANELYVDSPPIPVFQQQILVADGAVTLQPLHRFLVLLLVVEYAQLPQLLAQEVLARLAQQIEHASIYFDDPGGLGVKDQDAVVRRLEQPAIANLRSAKVFFRRAQLVLGPLPLGDFVGCRRLGLLRLLG
jgi:hypothetical protein